MHRRTALALLVGAPLMVMGQAPPGGQAKMSRCPFHDDSTPSLASWPDGSFYCYACTAGQAQARG